MKMELRKQKFLIQYFSGNRTAIPAKVFTWDGAEMIALGHPARYVLQCKNNQVLIRNLFEPEDIKSPLLSFILNPSSFGKKIALSTSTPDSIELRPLTHALPISAELISKVGRFDLPRVATPLLEDVFYHKSLKRFGVSALVMMLALFLFKPSEPDLKTNEELIPKKYAKLIMSKPKEILKAPAQGGSNPSQAKVKAVARAFQSKTVQKSIKSILQGGLSKYSIMATGRAITSLSQKAVSTGTQPGVGLENKASDILAGSRVGAVQIGSDSGYGSGTGKNIKGQGKGQFEVGLNTADASVDEGLTKDEVARVIHAHINEIRFCYESAILKDSTLAGKVLIDFKINATGIVPNAGVSETSVNDNQVGNCLVAKLRNWKFPQPRGGVMVAVSYPFVFKSLSR